MTTIVLNDRTLPLATWNTANIAIILGAFALLCLPFQLLFGTSLLILMLAYATIGLGLGAFMVAGWSNAGAWLILFYLLGNGLIALYAKTALGQSLDSNLYVPLQSFLVMLIATCSMIVAMLLANMTKIGPALLKPQTDAAQLRWISWACFVIGSLGWVADLNAMDESGSGFGGFAFLRDLLLMAVIARTASVIEASNGQRSVDKKLLLIMASGILVGLLSNSKAASALPLVSYYATLFFYRYAIKWPQMLTVILLAAVTAYALGPLIHFWRGSGFQKLTLTERFQYTITNADIIFEQGGIEGIRYETAADFRDGYYDYFGDSGNQMFVGRYASIQQIDPVIMAATSKRSIGLEAIAPSLTQHIPKLLYPNKKEFSVGYEILVDYGLIDSAGGKFPTLPLAGQAFAAYGYTGVILTCFIAVYVLLLAWKKLAGDLTGNIFSIFFFCHFIVVYANQGSLDQYAGAALRYFPLFSAIFATLLYSRNLIIRIQH